MIFAQPIYRVLTDTVHILDSDIKLYETDRCRKWPLTYWLIIDRKFGPNIGHFVVLNIGYFDQHSLTFDLDSLESVNKENLMLDTFLKIWTLL